MKPYNAKRKIIDEIANTLALDFDGVIHKFSKGIHDCTIYDSPMKGTKRALEILSKRFKLIIFTCRARNDNALVDNGINDIWRWLRKYDLAQYIEEVTSEKPRALFYIDDKGITFENWDKILWMLT